jgi:hypothetical protein
VVDLGAVRAVPLDADGSIDELDGLVRPCSGILGGHEIAAIAPFLVLARNLHQSS